MIKSLKSTQNILSKPEEQIKILENGIFREGRLPRFEEKIKPELKPLTATVLQVNVGYMCNQTCKHCHVDAGPDRKEIMTKDTMTECLEVLKNNRFNTLDLTGGAPEMNPDFEWFVSQAAKTGIQEIIVRSNLTILVSNKKYRKYPEFFADNKVRVVSSLPFYKPEKTDRQRGEGVFKKSIEALQLLNDTGYGRDEDKLLDLVYNPSGAFLPANQQSLEADFRKELKKNYYVDFNNLLTITNLPISRFLEFLLRTENYDDYMETLVNAYNPATVEGLMCRNTISVRWDGYLYDCDFNQMLDLKVTSPSDHISKFNLKSLDKRAIVIGQHCYGCTAGAGSSCQGTLI